MSVAAVAPGHPPRRILHVDMDAFFVSVELLRRPELRGRPVVVGGAGERGVVASASYEARAHGVRSAQPSVRARALCPQATFLPGDHARYSEVSARVMAVLRRFTPLVEPISLDEAFLDASGTRRRWPEARELAEEVRAAVREAEHLECAVGVATVPFLAKLASRAAKPRPSPRGPVPGPGVVEVAPGEELDFLHPLPVGELWGVGPATLARLQRLGVATVGDLAAVPLDAVVAAVGRGVGSHLHALARGIDERRVEPHRDPKTVGHEETYANDLRSPERLRVEVVRLADGVAGRLRAGGWSARTVTLKVRFADLRTTTRSATLPAPVDTADAISHVAHRLLAEVDVGAGVRLLGVSAGGLVQHRQLALPLGGGGPEPPLAGDPAGDPGGDAGGDPERWGEAERAVDAIRHRFGPAAIGPAALVEGPGQPPRTPRQARPWGPDPADPGP